jgi:hypothetical protein
MEAVKKIELEGVYPGTEPVRLPKEERETVIRTADTSIFWNEAEGVATVQTHNRALQNRLEVLGIELFGEDINTKPPLKFYKVPSNWISIRPQRQGNPDIAQHSQKGVEARKRNGKRKLHS